MGELCPLLQLHLLGLGVIGPLGATTHGEKNLLYCRQQEIALHARYDLIFSPPPPFPLSLDNQIRTLSGATLFARDFYFQVFFGQIDSLGVRVLLRRGGSRVARRGTLLRALLSSADDVVVVVAEAAAAVAVAVAAVDGEARVREDAPPPARVVGEPLAVRVDPAHPEALGRVGRHLRAQKAAVAGA